MKRLLFKILRLWFYLPSETLGLTSQSFVCSLILGETKFEEIAWILQMLKAPLQEKKSPRLLSREVFINKNNGDKNPVHAQGCEGQEWGITQVSEMFITFLQTRFSSTVYIRQYSMYPKLLFCGVLVSSAFYYNAKCAVQAHIWNSYRCFSVKISIF